ncbi:MAG: rhodanese-like domain-containing protein [Candidatus Omnitrophica bacterium]|nr:rhodanese-like domain-containing protein [Candidatus Omnitrophota bacterium]
MLKTINRDELVRMMQSAERFRLIDVLPRESFEKEHIKGAISLPLAEIEKKAGRIFRKDEKIVVYCASFECHASTEAGEKFLALGFKNTWDYKGGLKDFKEGNLPLLEGSLHKKTAQAEQICRSCACG